jgi:hypothetical protein
METQEAESADSEGIDQQGDLVKLQHDQESGRYHVTLPVDFVRSAELEDGDQLYVGEPEESEATGILEPVHNLFR